ncbi:Crp/Fnr family transcriptional regulator [Sulfitobacter aestuarii]|uniref:Crp/Fnr family transcriptional regulator n=1 Tax=Sulfitobacter aestuarii TaxID=2161676 RepID=A0ABW5U695_9RHOB
MRSSFVSRLARNIDLTPEERAFAALMEQGERQVAAKTVLLREGDALEELHILRYGWAVVRGRVINGRAPILRIYLPGEIIGLAELGRVKADHMLQMQTDGAISTFRRTLIPRLFAEAPRLAALLMALGSLDQIIMRERIAALSRFDSTARLIHFLLLMRDRLANGSGNRSARFELPFSQPELADLLGLTPVYVNKVFKRLREQGRIEVDRRTIRLLDVTGMERQVGYRDLHQALDTSWFPLNEVAE